MIYTVFNVLPDVHKEKQELQELSAALMANANAREKLKSIYIETDPTMVTQIETMEKMLIK